MSAYEEEVEAIFGVPAPSKGADPSPELTACTYVYTRYARAILERELALFENAALPVKYPSIYAALVKDALARLSADMRDIKAYMARANLRVDDKPRLTAQGNTVSFTYWHRGRIGEVGGAKYLVKKRVEGVVAHYMNVKRPANHCGPIRVSARI
ncbi:hypothetical protein [Shouchella clausii]|uniref:hypothetical protein n=1 Tax=Shouchella clausii TaxID=79880 RepID=UPI000BA79F09|nr:hypothetical protein [Shouchella clausii]PAD91634.1 hypothetical protein CHH52_13500 [Shouchella clausii]